MKSVETASKSGCGWSRHCKNRVPVTPQRVSKQHVMLLIILPALCAMVGCASTGNYHTSRGAAIGTGLGTVAGAVIGSQSGNAGEGALVGAAVGALGGGLMGQVQDTAEERDAAIAHASYLEHQQQGLTNNDVIMMSQNQLGDKVIISSIQSRGGRFDLSPQALVMLKQSGVSDNVLQAMQTSGPIVAVPPTVIAAEPPPVVFVEPAPLPPRSHVGIVFDFHKPRRRFRHHHWHH